MDEAQLSSDDRAFVDELRVWLSEHLTGEFKEHRRRRRTGRRHGTGSCGSPGRSELGRRPLAQRLVARASTAAGAARHARSCIFHIEHAAAGAPYWVGVHGRDLFGPTLLEYRHGRAEGASSPRSPPSRSSGVRVSASPTPAPTWPALRTRAERDGDEWVITGQKIWMTFGAYADWLYVLCRTDPSAQASRASRCCSSPAHQPGVDVRPIRNIAGGREFCEVFFDDARTPRRQRGRRGRRRLDGRDGHARQRTCRCDRAAVPGVVRARDATTCSASPRGEGSRHDPSCASASPAPGPACGSWSSTTIGC